MKKLLFCVSVFLNASFSYGQIAISSNSNTTPHSAAMLEIRPSLTTNAKGVLMPCISYSDIFNISSPRFGLLVGESSVNSSMYYYTGQQWSKMVNFTDQPSNITFLHRSNVAGNVFSVSNNNISGRSIVAENTAAGVGIFTSSNAGTGILAQANGLNGVAVSGNSNDGKAVYGTTSAGIGGFFEHTGRSGKALYTNGDIQFANNGEALNRVLTSDAAGIATWQELPKIAFMAINTASGFTVPANSTQTLDFDGTDFNVGGGFSTATDRFTAYRSGIFHLDIQLFGQANMVTTYLMYVYIYNASNTPLLKYTYFITPTTSEVFRQYSRSLDVSMNSTDYVVVQISTTTTPDSTFTIGASTSRATTFSGHYVCGL